MNILRRALYKIFVNNIIINTLNLPVVGIIIPPMVGLYYGTLDIWGDDWKIISEHKEVHEFIFTVLSVITIFTLFIRGVSEQIKSKISIKYNELLEELILLIGDLVKKKKDRFHKKAKELKRGVDAFKLITQPKDQINQAIDGTKSFISKGFGIDRKNICITIIAGEPETDTWWYEFQCDTQWQHTKPKVIMTSNSTAKYCYNNGESIFIPDLRKGIKEGIFYESERYNRRKSGSLYCKPVRVEIDNKSYIYIFTIVIYGELLCTPYDLDECNATEKIFDQISDRIELELYLNSMKKYRESRR
jgi:hypothetical protein